MNQENSSRVAVIGAGISGIMAAIQLKKKGYQVKIYEKKTRIGGKSYTKKIKLNGDYHSIDLGTSVVAISFKNILKYARILREPLFTPTPYKILAPDGNINSMNDVYLPLEKRWKLIRQLLKYWKHVSHFHRKYMTPMGYASYIPEKYQSSFTDFCAQHNMRDLCKCFDLPVAAWGYTHQENIPTWYVFGEMDAKAMISLLFTLLFGRSLFVKSLKNGYGSLLQRIALYHDLEIHFQVEINKIQRTSQQVLLHFKDGKEVFDSVILSDPTQLNIIENPSEQELKIIDTLEYAPYATVLCSLEKAIPAKLILRANLSNKIGIKLVSSPIEDLPLTVCYLAIDCNSKTSEVIDIIHTELGDYGIVVNEIHQVQLWKNYFPHFKSFKGYQALKAMQGEHKTFLVGSIHQFEFIEAAAANTIAIIDHYFPTFETGNKPQSSSLKNLWYWFFNG